MPKYVFEWYVEMQGEYVIEAKDRETAADIWDETSLGFRLRSQPYSVENSDLMNIRELAN